MTDTLTLVGIGLAGGVALSAAGQALLRLVRGRSGAYGGTWEQLVHDGRGGVRARDRVSCHQSGTKVEGTIRRLEPLIENYKEWRFTGHVTDGLLNAIYWSPSPARTPQVHGALYLAPREGDRREGLLSTRQLSQHSDRFLDTALEVKLVWQRPGSAPVITAPEQAGSAQPAPQSR